LCLSSSLIVRLWRSSSASGCSPLYARHSFLRLCLIRSNSRRAFPRFARPVDRLCFGPRRLGHPLGCPAGRCAQQKLDPFGGQNAWNGLHGTTGDDQRLAGQRPPDRRRLAVASANENSLGKRFCEARDRGRILGDTGRFRATETALSRVSGGKAAEVKDILHQGQETVLAQDCGSSPKCAGSKGAGERSFLRVEPGPAAPDPRRAYQRALAPQKG